MHGVPKDLPLDRLVGLEFNLIGIGSFQLQFQISGVVSMHVEGRWELRDEEDILVDFSQELEDRDAFRIHRIIGVPIVGFSLQAPSSFTLLFQSGHRLTVYDDSDQYESFSLHFDGEPGWYI